MPTPTTPMRAVARAFAKVEPHELKAVVLAFFYFFFLLGSYFILRPVRDAMGTVFSETELATLWTGTFFGSFAAALIYAFAASKLKLSTLLPWVYGIIALSLTVFYALFTQHPESRPVAGTFYIWVSVINLLIISVFWSFMADLFSRSQSKRLFGVVAAGGSAGGVAGPAVATFLVEPLGVANLLLISAVGFLVVIGVLRLLVREKAALVDSGGEAQPSSLDHTLSANHFGGWSWLLRPFDGFGLLLRSPFLLLIAAFVLLLTWISTILYFQQQEFVAQVFESREARTQAFGVRDMVVNVLAVGIQLFGTSRIVTRFGVTTGLVLNPIIMILAFLALAVSPVLMMLMSVEVVRRVAEYAVAKPSREMLFTAVDQETKYKAKNVIDTVVYRFGDLSAAWAQAGLAAAGLGAVGVALFGVGVAVVWGAVALTLGRRFERVREGTLATAPAAAPAE